MFQSVCVCAFKREYTLWVWHYCHNKEGGKYLYGLLYGPFQLYTIISNVLACATTISVLHILWQPGLVVVSLSLWEISSEIEELQVALNCSSSVPTPSWIYLSQKYLYRRNISLSEICLCQKYIPSQTCINIFEKYCEFGNANCS